jgi:6-phosphogluconolactonase
MQFTFGDERMVPPDHPDSNYGMARRTLFEPAGVRDDQVLRIRGEAGAERAVDLMNRALVVWAQRSPLFDLVLLGLGEDGHVASLFPAEAWPPFGTRWTVATRHPGGEPRVSLTPDALQSAAVTVFLVTGVAKAEAVARTLTAETASDRTPARRVVAPGGRALWFLDEAAASRLPGKWMER